MSVKKLVKLCLFVSCLWVFLIGCTTSINDSSDEKNDNKKPKEKTEELANKSQASVAITAITIDGVSYEKTGEMNVLETSATITGETPSCVTDGEERDKGVFTPGRTITLSPYIIGQYEVTRELYAAVMTGNKDNIDANPSKTGNLNQETKELLPVESVTWYDAVYFCNLLTEKTLGAEKKAYEITNIKVSDEGHITKADVSVDITKAGYRLPTEAEWEFAARGGNPSAPEWNYFFAGHASQFDGGSYNASSNTGLDPVGWYKANSGNYAHEVGLKDPNSIDLYDMSGNVLEKCQDTGIFQTLYNLEAGNFTNPMGPANGVGHVIRGGYYGAPAGWCSAFRRGGLTSDYEVSQFTGFRLARSRVD